MKIFVSWSGSVSQTAAKTLHQYIPGIIQSADVFFSQEDIEKGANWDCVLRNELSNSSYGIVCLTPQNINDPWINFEAGAMATTLDSRVSPLLIGVNFSDLNGPLTRYQATRINREDFFKLIQGINHVAADYPLDNSLLERSFDAFWPKIEKTLRSAEEAALKAQRRGNSYPYRLLAGTSVESDSPSSNRFPVNNSQVAVMMPFTQSPDIDPVFKAMEQGAADAGYVCRRVDQLLAPADITDDVKRLIMESRAVIADLSGMNPNVIYELGFSHGCEKRVILVSSDSLGNLPFDFRQQRVIPYHASKSGLEELRSKLTAALKAI